MNHPMVDEPGALEPLWITIVSGASRRWFAWLPLGLVTCVVFAITLRDYFGSDDFIWLAWARAATFADVLATFKLWMPQDDMARLSGRLPDKQTDTLANLRPVVKARRHRA